LSTDILPTILGIALVAAATVFALVPFVRGARPSVAPSEDTAIERSSLYRQVLELEFDYQVGKLSAEDYQQLSADLLARASKVLREERDSLGELDDELEREIAAARAAFAAARASTTRRKRTAGTPS
jgi:hypothetical protein